MKKISWAAKDSIAGMLLRWLMPSAILVPIALGYAQQTYALSVMTTTLCTIGILVAVVGRSIYVATRTESALRRSESLARIQVENRKDYAIFLLDTEGKVMSWNLGAERLMGYEAKDVLGTFFAPFFTVADQRADKPNEILKLAREEKHLEYEGWRIKKNGDPFWATITMSSVVDDNQQLIGFTKLVRNSTRQKEADDKLKKMVATLARSNQELERFAYIASHDLQEPLRMVSSYTQLLAKRYKDQLDKDALEYIDFAVDGALRMQQLITDLLTYSRVATKGKTLSRLTANSR